MPAESVRYGDRDLKRYRDEHWQLHANGILV